MIKTGPTNKIHDLLGVFLNCFFSFANFDSVLFQVEYNVETGIRRDLLSNETKSLLSDFATFVDFAPNNKNLMLFYDDEVI